MQRRLRSHFQTILGSVVIALGASIAGLYSFRGDVPIVMFGFLLFILGYRLSQVGITEMFGQNVTDGNGLSSVSRGIFLIVGWIGIAFGVTLFSQTILSPSVSNAVLSGVSSIGGYMCAHVGINGVGLGDSIFGPVHDGLERVFQGGH